MIPKKTIQLFASIGLCILLFNCTYKKEKTDCKRSQNVSIEYKLPLSFSSIDTLFIDDLKFTHVTKSDSIVLGSYLPNLEMVLLEVNGKQGKTKMNKLDIIRVLASKLKSTGNYKILNGPELITNGVLKVSRTDGKMIEICTSKGYLAKVNAIP
ncbi:hypothetical protein [Maribacter sp. 2-571]|uniref:hypothetical protein n=1 Tax=Maribacter sp. 2-571 TaxID=3417569 RepID=UPI003D33D33A